MYLKKKNFFYFIFFKCGVKIERGGGGVKRKGKNFV